MIDLAIKMLYGDRAKLLGLVFGVAFATLLITQQGGLFIGLMSRSQNVITESKEANIWVMHPATEYADLSRPMRNSSLFRVRGVTGVQWAVPLIKSSIPIQTQEGRIKNAMLLGIDDATLIGVTQRFVLGSPESLRLPDSVAIDRVGYMHLWPGKSLKLGKTIELNEHRAVVTAITDAAPVFSAQAIIYTRYSLATRYLPSGGNQLSFIQARAVSGLLPEEVAERITSKTGLRAYSSRDFANRTLQHYLKHTGIPINFGTTILLGIIVGAAIVGLTFNNFVSENLAHFAALKVIGVSNTSITYIVLVQVLFVSGLGFALGIGVAAAFFDFVCTPTSALRGFVLPWWVAIGAAGAILFVVLLSTLASLRRVWVLDPATVIRR